MRQKKEAPSVKHEHTAFDKQKMLKSASGEMEKERESFAAQPPF